MEVAQIIRRVSGHTEPVQFHYSYVAYGLASSRFLTEYPTELFVVYD